MHRAGGRAASRACTSNGPVDDAPCPNVIGDPRPGTSDFEQAHWAVAPTHIYPLFETALRAGRRTGRGASGRRRRAVVAVRRGRGREPPRVVAHRVLGRRDPHDSPDNRMVVFPYTKRMCANIDVDQGAAVLLCSYEAAATPASPTTHGVPACRRRRARPLVRHRTGLARRGTRDRRDPARPRSSRRPYDHRRRSPASISTRASRPRSRWPCTRSGCGAPTATTVRSPSPAASDSRAAR